MQEEGWRKEAEISKKDRKKEEEQKEFMGTIFSNAEELCGVRETGGWKLSECREIWKGNVKQLIRKKEKGRTYAACQKLWKEQKGRVRPI